MLVYLCVEHVILLLQEDPRFVAPYVLLIEILKGLRYGTVSPLCINYACKLKDSVLTVNLLVP